MGDIIWDCKSYTNKKESNIKKFQKLLRLHEVSGITLISIKCTNILYVNSNLECTQFEVDFNLAMDFGVQLKVDYPKIVLFSDKIENIGKLRIMVADPDVKHELISCTNYLQRQRNINLTVSILKKCATLVAERKLILDMLRIHSDNEIFSQAHEDGGITIRCENKTTNFTFFESLWRIQFDCSNHHVLDFIDFSVSNQNYIFHDAVKSAMTMLVQPNMPYNKKVDLWWGIIQASRSSPQHRTHLPLSPNTKEFINVCSARRINTERDSMYEIVESDDEDCIVIDD